MRQRRIDAILAAVIIVPLLALFGGRLQRLDFQAQDRAFHLRGERPPRPEVVIVALDDQTLLQVGPWPWPLEKIARLVEAVSAAQPAVIGLDLESLLAATLSSAATPEGREALRQALARSGKVVLPAVLKPTEEARLGPRPRTEDLARFAAGEGALRQPPHLQGGQLFVPYPSLIAAAAGLGALNVTPETDRILREMPLVVAEGNTLYPSFAAEAVRVYSQLPPGRGAYTVSGGRVRLGQTSVALATGGEYMINYAGDFGTYPQVSAGALLGGADAKGRAELAGRIALVGLVSGPEAGMLSTPIAPLPAVEVEANAVGSLLPEGGLRVLPGWVAWVLALAGALLMALALGMAEARLALIATGGVVVCYFGVATAAFWRDLLLPFAVPTVAWAAVGVVIVIMSAAAAERAKAEAEGQAAARIHTLMNLGELLTRGLDRRLLLDDILRWVQKELRVEAASLLLMDPKRPCLHFEAAIGGSPEAIMDFTVELGQGIAGTVAMTGEPAIVNDAGHDPRQARDIAQAVNFPTRDILCVPMVRQGKVVGVIEAINRQGGEPFTTVEADLLSVIAQQAALFLENARLYGELQQRVDFANAELRATNEKLASEKARVDTLLREMASGVLATDEAERIILVNHLAEGMLGLRQETALGQSVFAAVADDRILEMFATPLSPRGGLLVRELELPAGSGRVVRAHLTMFEMRGEAIGKCLLLTDVTQFVELDEMKTDLISFVSHELKNPLSAMLAFINLMRGNAAANTEPLSRYVRHVQEQAANMQDLVQDYLNVARLEAGRPLEVDWEELEDVRGYVTELIAAHAPSYEREIELQIPENLPAVWADRQQLRQILLNLVGNAVKYTPQGTPITVQAEAREGCMCFAVIDRGPGLDEASQEHLFEKFRRVRGASRERVPGTGIGLYLCKHLVEAHGGKIWVESRPGEGATFRFTLPTQRPEGAL
jgi:two-component system phosphate regulon sensor histidine kinase PhoR